MRKLIVVVFIMIFTVSNSIIALADKVEDAYFISLMTGMEQVVRTYRENLKSILEDKKFNPKLDCQETSKGLELFQKSLIMFNEIEVTLKLKEFQRLYKVLLRERRAMSAKLEEVCYAKKLTPKDDEHFESISKRIDLLSYQVSVEGKKHKDYFIELEKEVSDKDIEKFETEFLERLKKLNID